MFGAVWLKRTFLVRRDVIAIEISRALFELAEILYRTQGALAAVDLLIEQTAQAGRIEPETPLLRAHIRREMESGIGMEIHMAIQACHTELRLRDLAVIGHVEFFLRVWLKQQAQ